MRANRAQREPIRTIEIPWRTCKWGYRINIGHPLISPLFHEWKIANGLSPRWPISDENRLRFESLILEAIATYCENVEEYLKFQLDHLEEQNKRRRESK